MISAITITILAILVSLAFQAYALNHLFNKNTMIIDDNMRRIWALIIIFGSVLGVLTYFLAVRSNE